MLVFDGFPSKEEAFTFASKMIDKNGVTEAMVVTAISEELAEEYPYEIITPAVLLNRPYGIDGIRRFEAENRIREYAKEFTCDFAGT